LSAFDPVIGKALEQAGTEMKMPEQKAGAGQKPAVWPKKGSVAVWMHNYRLQLKRTFTVIK